MKIADFGIAGPAAGRDGNGYLKTIAGTEGYMAPEIWRKEPYKGQAIDVFSCGVILFALVTGNAPFESSKETDPCYKYIMQQ